MIIFILALFGLARLDLSCVGCLHYGCGCGMFSCEYPIVKKSFHYYETGLLNGFETSPPWFDFNFLYEVYPVCPCTYRKQYDDCSVPHNSGVYIGAEIDIINAKTTEYGQITNNAGTLSLYQIAMEVIEKASSIDKKCKIDLITGKNTCLKSYALGDLREINDKYMNYTASKMMELYNACREKVFGPKFEELPRGIRTALYFTHYLNMDTKKYPDMWRAFILQNWEWVVDRYASDEEGATSEYLYSMNIRRQRSLIEYAYVEPCYTKTKSMSFLLVIDSNDSTAVQEILSTFIKTLSEYNGYNLYIAVLWQSKYAVQKHDFAKINVELVNTYKVSDCVHKSAVPLLDAAQNLLESRPNTMDIPAMVYIGEEIIDDIKIFPQLIELQNSNTLLYAIQTTNVYPKGNIKIMARTSGIVYKKSEVSNLIEALDNWHSYYCTLPQHIGEKGYKYNVIVPEGKAVTNYFVYRGLSNDIKARNVTIDITADSINNTEVYYSTKYKNPTTFLRDGIAPYFSEDILDGIDPATKEEIKKRIEFRWLYFDYMGTPSKTIAAEHYYAITSNKSQQITIDVYGNSTIIPVKCTDNCLSCDLMGQNCRKCAEHYENIRGKCRKAYVETDLPMSREEKRATYPASITVLAILIIAWILVFVVIRNDLAKKRIIK